MKKLFGECGHTAYVHGCSFIPETENLRPKRAEIFGVPEVIRTPDLPLRRRSLYPAELRKQTDGITRKPVRDNGALRQPIAPAIGYGFSGNKYYSIMFRTEFQPFPAIFRLKFVQT